MAKILLVEDEESIRGFIKINLIRNGFEVIEAGSGEEGIKKALNEKPDMAILDVMLPGIDGFQVCSKLRNEYPKIGIIMLTAKGQDMDKIMGLEYGADDYIVKPFRTRELISRIKSVLRRYGKKEENNIIQYKNIKIDTISAKVYKNNKEIIFTSLEYRILLMLFTNQNKLITREQLLEKIWDIAGNFVNDNTLTVYIKRIREKLEDDSIIKTIRGLGYRIGD